MKLSDLQRAGLFGILDDIAVGARAAHRGRISARLLGRVLAYRVGLPVWDCQRELRRGSAGE
jgi:hypothetical protein